LAVQAGTYTVSIYDAQNCLHTDSYSVDQPPLLEQSASVTDDHCTQFGGEITITPEGGTGPDELESSGGTVFPGSYRVINLSEGDYTVTLTDAHGCTLVESFSILNIEGPDVTMPPSPTITCETGPALLSPFVINPGGGDLEYYWTTNDGD